MSPEAEVGALRRGGSPTRPRVLVVDDNEDAAELLATALGDMGYEPRVAHDATEALRVAADFVPRVALLDLGLPVIDGYELASRLRALPELAALQLIAITGYGEESDRRRAETAGFAEHFVKPVDLAAIGRALTAATAG
jgi:CheY-like chemotaxis protein